MSNKWFKRLLGFVAIGAAVGGAIAYFTKKNGCSCDCDDEFADDIEDEDFDLDDDLKEVSREYVSLTPEKENVEVKKTTEEKITEESAEEETIEKTTEE